jgi:hypothetical protein
MAIPDPPYQAFLVDLARRITIPWKDWIVSILLPQVNAALEAIGVIENKIATFQPVMFSTTLELSRGRRSGVSFIEPDGGFEEAQIGRPVQITQAPSPRFDDLDLEMVVFAGEVVDKKRLRVWWRTIGP